jgi:thiamine pyrophosphokinase
MKIHIVAGGPEEFIPSLKEYNEGETLWVGVDRGTLYLLKNNIVPNQAFGDFDSVAEEELTYIKSKVQHLDIHPSEKDATDTEIAFNWALQQKPSIIRIFGATGGRLDHYMANIQLMLKADLSHINIEIIDKRNIVTIKKPGSYEVQHLKHFRYVSFVPISEEIKGLTLIGFKYPLNNCHITWGSTLCISNELINSSGTFSFESGILMMIRSRD